jgi:tRNA U34 5-carboxymethylaminomethyl modifying GTPase MnmE/TrmE
VAERLRECRDALGDLVGRIAPDDVLARVFATFCVGK